MRARKARRSALMPRFQVSPSNWHSADLVSSSMRADLKRKVLDLVFDVAAVHEPGHSVSVTSRQQREFESRIGCVVDGECVALAGDRLCQRNIFLAPHLKMERGSRGRQTEPVTDAVAAVGRILRRA